MGTKVFGPTKLMSMEDVKQADKVSKEWSKAEWRKNHEANFHKFAPNPYCPHCSESFK